MNTKTIKLDINKKLYQRITAKQRDVKSRYLFFHLLDGAIPFNLNGKSVRVYALKPDKTEIFNDLQIVDAAKGICKLELTTQTLAIDGIVLMEIMVTEGLSKLTSNIFELEVGKSINSEKAIVSTNEFTALVNGLASLSEYDNYKNEIKNARGSAANLPARLAGIDSHLADIAINVDNFPTIQDAIDNCKENGTVIFSPFKTYTIYETLLIKSNITLDLNGATIQPTNKLEEFKMITNKDDSNENICIKNGVIDGCGYLKVGMLFSNVKGLKLENLSIKNLGKLDLSSLNVNQNSGFYLYKCIDFEINNITVSYCKGVGLQIGGECKTDGSVLNSKFIYNGNSGVDVSSYSTDVRIDKCYFYNNAYIEEDASQCSINAFNCSVSNCKAVSDDPVCKLWYNYNIGHAHVSAYANNTILINCESIISDSVISDNVLNNNVSHLNINSSPSTQIKTLKCIGGVRGNIVTKSDNCIISDISIDGDGSFEQLSITDSNNCILTDLHLKNGKRGGVKFVNSSNNRLKNSTIEDNNKSGLTGNYINSLILDNLSNNNVIENCFIKSKNGIAIISSNGNYIMNCIIISQTPIIQSYSNYILDSIINGVRKTNVCGESNGVDIVITQDYTAKTITGINELDVNFKVLVEPNWNTTWWITEKFKTQFKINFGTPAPNGAKINWTIMR